MDPSQISAIQHCLNRDFSFLWGPPGTGKTHSLGHLIAAAAVRGERIIATAISNVAVDQIALHLVKALRQTGGEQFLHQGRVIRFGHARLPEVLAERCLFPNEEVIQQTRNALYQARQAHRRIPERAALERAKSQKRINDLASELRRIRKERLENAQVILTTAVQTCMEGEIAATEFNLAVIDEASMMPVPYVAAIAALSSERLVVTGDFRQLGPIALARSAAAYEWLHQDLFSRVGINQNVHHPSVAMLQVQRRMHSTICNMINAPFYKGILQTATPIAKTQAKRLPPISDNPTVLVHLGPEDGSKVELTPAGSRRNQASGELAARLARHYLATDPSVTIGIISPYRAQCEFIRRLLKDPILSPDVMLRVKTGTIHAFQGSEADVIIWDLVDTQDQTIGRLYHGDAGNRLSNVAISRAQGKLVVLGDVDVFFEARGAESVLALKGILWSRFTPGSGNVVSISEIGDIAAAVQVSGN